MIRTKHFGLKLFDIKCSRSIWSIIPFLGNLYNTVTNVYMTRLTFVNVQSFFKLTNTDRLPKTVKNQAVNQKFAFVNKFTFISIFQMCSKSNFRIFKQTLPMSNNPISQFHLNHCFDVDGLILMLKYINKIQLIADYLKRNIKIKELRCESISERANIPFSNSCNFT